MQGSLSISVLSLDDIYAEDATLARALSKMIESLTSYAVGNSLLSPHDPGLGNDLTLTFTTEPEQIKPYLEALVARSLTYANYSKESDTAVILHSTDNPTFANRILAGIRIVDTVYNGDNCQLVLRGTGMVFGQLVDEYLVGLKIQHKGPA